MWFLIQIGEKSSKPSSRTETPEHVRKMMPGRSYSLHNNRQRSEGPCLLPEKRCWTVLKLYLVPLKWRPLAVPPHASRPSSTSFITPPLCVSILYLCAYTYAHSITNIHCIEYTLTYTHMCSVCTTYCVILWTCINIYIYNTIIYILTDWNLECAPGFQKSLFRKLRMRRSPGRRPDS